MTPVHRRRTANFPGAGALRSAARDLLSYLRAQLQPDQTPLGEAIRLTQVLLEPTARMTVGLGWIRSLRRAGPTFWHGGTGGFAAFLRDRGHGSVVLVNDQQSPTGWRCGYSSVISGRCPLAADPRVLAGGLRSLVYAGPAL